ncbi:MAG TPA: phage major capsid protein [Chloroflexi bacterium]|jgi:HK97 family phage major capsid protein|nr:phage major capsid protein [Chloroflexota bacterium]HAL28753.1 phage major capsid protein [Chloroflexota bacterium]
MPARMAKSRLLTSHVPRDGSTRSPSSRTSTATAGGLASGGASIFSSGFVGGWASETPAFADVDPVFGLFDISVKKLRTATRLGVDFVSDSLPDVLAFLSRSGGTNLALVEDQGFLIGDGGSLQLRGLLNSGITTVDLEGSTSNTISNTTSAAGSAPKLRTLCYGLPSQYAARASWITKRTVEGSIRALVDNSNRPLFEEEEEGTLLQKPIANSDFMPPDGTDTNKVALFGDLSAYVIAQRVQISVTILNERFRDVDQLGIIIRERVGGGLYNEDALRIGVV